jgi:hypothetical protein
MTDIREEILQYIKANPGCYRSHIVNMHPTIHANSIISTLINEGLVQENIDLQLWSVESMTPKVKKIPIEEYDSKIHGSHVFLFPFPESAFFPPIAYKSNYNQKWFYAERFGVEIPTATHFVPLSALLEVIE